MFIPYSKLSTVLNLISSSPFPPSTSTEDLKNKNSRGTRLLQDGYPLLNKMLCFFPPPISRTLLSQLIRLHLIFPNVSTIHTNEKQRHLRLRPSRLTLEKHSLPMLAFRTLLIRTGLESAHIPSTNQAAELGRGDLAAETYQSRITCDIRSHTSRLGGRLLQVVAIDYCLGRDF